MSGAVWIRMGFSPIPWIILLQWTVQRLTMPAFQLCEKKSSLNITKHGDHLWYAPFHLSAIFFFFSFKVFYYLKVDIFMQDDFEDICHNAMSYQEKGSMIWEAASTLLDKGKRYLDQYANRAIKFFGLHTKLEHRSPCDHGASSNDHYKIETMVHQEGESSFLKSSKEHGAVLHGKCNNLPNQNSVNVLGNSDMTDPHLDESFQNFPGSTLLCTQNMISVQEQDECRSNAEATFDMIEANTQVDDLNVEILDCTGDGNRFNPINQATECSSSFGGTEIDIADDDDSGCKMYDAAEIESDLRNGNGAAIAPEYDSGGFQKRYLSRFQSQFGFDFIFIELESFG